MHQEDEYEVFRENLLEQSGKTGPDKDCHCSISLGHCHRPGPGTLGSSTAVTPHASMSLYSQFTSSKESQACLAPATPKPRKVIFPFYFVRRSQWVGPGLESLGCVWSAGHSRLVLTQHIKLTPCRSMQGKYFQHKDPRVVCC